MAYSHEAPRQGDPGSGSPHYHNSTDSVSHHDVLHYAPHTVPKVLEAAMRHGVITELGRVLLTLFYGEFLHLYVVGMESAQGPAVTGDGWILNVAPRENKL